MISLHAHSMYSALDGYSTPKEIADRIAQIGLPGGFLTDHGTVAGLPEFRKEMEKQGLFCGYGVEAYQARTSRKIQEGFKAGEDTFHLVLVAKNIEGYRNLFRLTDEANRSGFYYKPRVDWELLEKYHDGIIATSACMASLICNDIRNDDRSSLDQMLKIFKDDFFLELHTYDHEDQRAINHELVSIGQERGIPVVFANDAHYAFPEQYEIHEAFYAAQMGGVIDEPKGKYANVPDDPTKYHPPCLYIMDEAEVRKALDHLPERIVDEALDNSDAIMEMCRFELPETKLHLPKYPTPDPAGLLIEETEKGLWLRFGEDCPEEVYERAEYELQTLIEAGLHDYFLIVWDYVKDALEEGIFVGPGRGSVGGSLVAYALGFSNVDPIKYELQFERFWNPGRAAGLPDVDVDFEKGGRPRVLEKLRRKYGENRVMPISNHTMLWPKSAIDKAGMVLYGKQAPWGLMRRTKQIIETTEDAGKLLSWEETEETIREDASLWEEYSRLKDAEPDLFFLAEQFSERLHTYGQHASAVVIADIDLQDEIPGRLANDKDSEEGKQMVTQFEMHTIEDLGFVKFDLLRIRNLDTILRAAQLSGEFK